MRKIEAVGLWCWGAIPDCVLGHDRNRQSSEGNRSEGPELPQSGRSEPGTIGGEGRRTSSVYQSGGARGQGRVGGRAMETIASVAGADGVAVAGSVKGSGWGPRAVLARGNGQSTAKPQPSRRTDILVRSNVERFAE
jgi:hypothetical protein